MTLNARTCLGYRHVQLRSSNNQPLDLSTLFVCCKLEDDSWGVHTTDVGVSSAVTGEWRGGVDPGVPGKKAATRSATAATAVRPRDDSLVAPVVDKEVRVEKSK